MVSAGGLSSALSTERILLLECSTKKEALEELIRCLAQAPEVRDPDELRRGIFHREELMSTGIGMGIAVPHVRLASVDKPVMCVGICRNPVTDYESLDDQPVRIILMIAAGKDQHAQYLRLLSSVSARLKDEHLRNALVDAPDAETVYRLLTEQNR